MSVTEYKSLATRDKSGYCHICTDQCNTGVSVQPVSAIAEAGCIQAVKSSRQVNPTP